MACPLLQETGNVSENGPVLYAAQGDDSVRAVSTSGGVFTAVANETLRKGGVVYAVVFDKDFRAIYQRFEDEADLMPARGSKYVQTQPGDIFAQVKQDLKQGIEVCFVGIPCQVAGLVGFLGTRPANLLTVDMLCDFAPSPAVLQRYLEDACDKPNLSEVRFRTKDFGWVADVCRLTYKDGSVQFRRDSNDSFQQGFHAKLFMPKACEHCHFSGYPKQGDITMGDFWYIDEHDPSLDDGAGTSVLLVNSEKGDEVFRAIRNALPVCEEEPLRLLDRNRPLKAEPAPERDRFYELLAKYPFDKAVDWSLNHRYDVGVLGVWSEDNYGSEITYLALYKHLKSLGLEVLMIERPADSDWRPSDRPVLFKENPYDPYDLSPLFESTAQMHQLNEQCRSFVLGSDQMWHDELFYPFSQFGYLDYIHKDRNKISYATSFGKATWDGSDEQRQLLRYYLKRFDAVSVRESSGIEICQNVFDVDAHWAIDPVFICDREVYTTLASPADGSNYIGCYILDVNEDKQRALNYLSQRTGLDLKIITDARTPNKAIWNLPVMFDASAEDWLSMFIHAKYVVTDSFHGMCFALMFHKPFIAIVNSARGATRFRDYVEMLSLEACLVPDARSITEQHMSFPLLDWEAIEHALQIRIDAGQQWLQQALATPTDRELSTFDIVGDRIAKLYPLKAQVRDNAGMIAHHENVFRDAFGQIEELKDQMRSVNRIMDKLRRIKHLFKKNNG
jgi:Coenzyme F420-reducing hydrogenase, beta subunit